MRFHSSTLSARLASSATLPLRIWLYLALLLCCIMICFFLFFAVEQPIRDGNSSFRLGADSDTYYAVADLLRNGSSNDLALLSFSGNLLGPIAMAMLFKSPLFIMMANLAIFLLSIQLCAPVNGLNRTLLGLLLALNATTIVSIVTLNKEIFALASALLFSRFIYSKTHRVLILSLSLLLGLAARWQQPAIILMFLFFWRPGCAFRKRPWLAVSLVIGGITLAYPYAVQRFSADLAFAIAQAQTGRLIVILNALQAHYAYPLAVIPKALMSLFNPWLTPNYFLANYWENDFHDLANQFVIHLQTMAMLIAFIFVAHRGRLRLGRPIPFFIVLYLSVTSANTFIQPRYQYPVYVLLCFELARQTKREEPSVLQLRLRKPMRLRLKSGYTAQDGVSGAPERVPPGLAHRSHTFSQP